MLKRALVLAAVAGACSAPVGATVPASATAAPAARACAEDAACWTWSTMGNHRRAIVTRAGRRIVVGPCTYGALHAARFIDHRRTPKLRGDYTARGAC